MSKQTRLLSLLGKNICFVRSTPSGVRTKAMWSSRLLGQMQAANGGMFSEVRLSPGVTFVNYRATLLELQYSGKAHQEASRKVFLKNLLFGLFKETAEIYTNFSFPSPLPHASNFGVLIHKALIDALSPFLPPHTSV